MPRKKEIPNYLQPITITLTIILLAFFLLIISTSSNDKANIGLNDSLIQNNLISQNLISYLQKEIITQPQISESSPVLGDPDAPITIFEYSSFSCLYGVEIQPVIKKITETYPKQVKIIWKDLPMAETYPDANLAHRAGRCAQQQNKFWQYYELLWQNQNDFSLNNLKNLAKEIDLDENLFAQCLNNENIQALINQDIAEADQLLISGTPHFYINSQELMGLATFEDFEKIIKVELSR